MVIFMHPDILYFLRAFLAHRTNGTGNNRFFMFLAQLNGFIIALKKFIPI